MSAFGCEESNKMLSYLAIDPASPKARVKICSPRRKSFVELTVELFEHSLRLCHLRLKRRWLCRRRCSLGLSTRRLFASRRHGHGRRRGSRSLRLLLRLLRVLVVVPRLQVAPLSAGAEVTAFQGCSTYRAPRAKLIKQHHAACTSHPCQTARKSLCIWREADRGCHPLSRTL